MPKTPFERPDLTEALMSVPGFEAGHRAALQYKEFGAKLRVLREELGLTQKALAELSGIDQADISRYEAGLWGKRGLSYDVLHRVLPVLGAELHPIVRPAANFRSSTVSRDAMTAMSGMLHDL